MKLWRWLCGKYDPPEGAELRRKAIESMNTIEEANIQQTRDIREQIAEIRERIQSDPDFPMLGNRRRVVINRRIRP